MSDENGETRETEGVLGSVGEVSEDPDGTDGFLEVEDRQSAEIREIFGTAFPQYLQPVEEMVEQILSGKGDRESLEALGGMLDSLESASTRMGFDDVRDLLKQLHGKVSELDTELMRGPAPAEVREAILGDVLELRDLADQMGGGAAEEAGERQKTIFAALQGKEEVGDLVLRRLSAAGLITVDQLLSARTDEICAVTGLGPEIVEKVLGLLSEDSPEEATQAPLPAGVESLHEQVLQKLRAEVEAEASVEDLRTKVRKLRDHVLERRAELDSIDSNLVNMKKEMKKLSRRMADRAAYLEDIRSRRDKLLRKCSSSEETVRQEQIRMEVLNRERRNLREQVLGLGRAVSGLLGSLGKVRRLVAKGRSQDTK